MSPLARGALPGVSLLGFLLAPSMAFAHTSERAYILLLPTGYYIAGGTIAVALSFALMFALPAAAVPRILNWRLRLFAVPRLSTTALSGFSLMVLLLLLLAGRMGSRDPLENPLPLSVWTLWWVGFTIAHALFGNLWAAFNPWLAPCRMLRRLLPPPRAYPDWLGYWPALLLFLGFAWFELVDPAPDDPDRLALVVASYWLGTLVGMLIYGERDWLAKAESFSVFFGFVARLSAFQINSAARRLLVQFPGASLSDTVLPLGGVLFVLLTLATVSFDGLSKTFWWLDLGGINPLEFPGRSAVMARNSLGLVAAWVALTIAYVAAIAIGRRLSGGRGSLGADLGAFALTILPISLAYHFSHYLTIFLVNGQYALLALNDPLGLGWNLLGFADRHVTMSFLNNFAVVSVIWRLQVGVVVLGHILAIALAHLIAVDRLGGGRAALWHQLPLAILMIGYTLFGLWLLAAPMAG